MITSIARMLQESLGHRQRPQHRLGIQELEAIRCQLERSIVDCMSPSACRLRRHIVRASTPQELWLLRNDAYQLISQQHDQSTAANRINALLPYFEGHLTPRQLVPIH